MGGEEFEREKRREEGLCKAEEGGAANFCSFLQRTSSLVPRSRKRINLI